jgi:hypothetical protein
MYRLMALALLAAAPALANTWGGNPVIVELTTVEFGVVHSFTTTVQHVAFLPCDPDDELYVEAFGQDVDFVAGFALPSVEGDWCGVDLVIDGAVAMAGTVHGESVSVEGGVDKMSFVDDDGIFEFRVETPEFGNITVSLAPGDGSTELTVGESCSIWIHDNDLAAGDGSAELTVGEGCGIWLHDNDLAAGDGSAEVVLGACTLGLAAGDGSTELTVNDCSIQIDDDGIWIYDNDNMVDVVWIRESH